MKALFLPSDALALELVNSRNPGANLSLAKVIVDTPVPNDDPEDLNNSKMLIRARKGKGFRDSQEVTFDRLDIAGLFRGTNIFLDVKEPKSTLELLDALRSGYGVNLRPVDIVSHDIPAGVNPPLENPEDPDPTPVEHTLTIASDCYAYIGEATVLIGAKPASGERLSLVITNTKLDGLTYPDGESDTKGQAYIYSYGVDCTAVAAWFATLADVVAGTELDPVRLATELNKVFYEEWSDQATEGNFNTHGAKLVFAGPTYTATADGPVWYEGTNQAYNRVVIVELSNLCANFQGNLYLHYNA